MKRFGVVELHVRKRPMIRLREMIKFRKWSGNSYEYYFLDDHGHQSVEGQVTIFENREAADRFFNNLISLIEDRGSTNIYLYHARGLTQGYIAKKIADSFRDSKYAGLEIMKHYIVNADGSIHTA